jgi:uncharacterized membrane protein
MRRINAASPELILLIAVTVVGATLRLATLGTQSYWADEANTVHELHLSLGGMLHAVTVQETTPPLYFVIAWLWAKLFGTGEVGLRALSALLGIGLIPLGYLCARELVSRWAGVVTATLVAVAPFTIYYAQEARSYALFAVLSAASFLLWARALDSPTNRRLAGWAAVSALAVLTHFFAGFLIAPEALVLLLRSRRRAVAIACLPIALAQAAVLPLAIGDTSHPLGWIDAFPRAVRIEQIPVQFGLGSLYQSSIVTHGLLGAGVLAVIVAALVLARGSSRERHGGAVAAAIAAAVVLVPIALAGLGRDYVVARNLTPAWIPLAVLLGAACTVPRARIAGGALVVVLVGGSLLAGVRIAANPRYQRPDWRGVAQALGSAGGPRAIVTYDGNFAAEPLAIYLPGIPWTKPAPAPVRVAEIDVVGSPWQAPPQPLPAGTSLLATRRVSGFLVERYRLAASLPLTPAAIAQRAGTLLVPAPPTPTVLIQRPSA